MSTPSPRVWMATFVALLLLIGASLGIVADRLWLLPRDRPPIAGPPPAGPGEPPPPPPLDRLVDDLDHELHLTAAQRTQVADVLDAHRPRIRAMQDDARSKFEEEQQALQHDIGAILTPAQLPRFTEMMQNRPMPIGRPGGPGGPAGRGRRGAPPPGRE